MSNSQNKKSRLQKSALLDKGKLATSIGISLFSHLVAKALFSAPLSLTSVFGMGTGGPSASSTPIKFAASFWLPQLGSNQ